MAQPSIPPSAPCLPTDRAYSINWSVLPVEPTSHSFFESSAVRASASMAIKALALLSGGATLFAAFAFKAAPMTVIKTTGGLALLTVSLLASSIALSRLTPSLNDPSELLSQRKAAGEALLNDRSLGYEQIRKQYLETVISNADINALVHMDIATLSYPEFIKKHGSFILDILDQDNIRALASSFMDHSLHTLTCLELKQMGKELKLFGIQQEQLISMIANGEAKRLQNNRGDYQTFIGRNGGAALRFIEDNAVKDYLADQFHQYAMAKNIGLIQLDAQHGAELKFFGRDPIAKAIRDREFTHFSSGQLTYSELKRRNGLEIVQHFSKDLQQLVTLRKGFFRSPYKDLMIVEDQTALGITPQELKEALVNRWNQQPIADLLNDTDFCQALKNPFTPADWKHKALNETFHMSIGMIVKNLSALFKTGILTHDDSHPDKPTFREQLQAEIGTFQTFEDLTATYGTIIFTSGLIERNDPRLSMLVAGYVTLHASDLLKGKTSRMIEQFDLMPNDIKSRLAASKSKYAKGMADFKAATAALEKKHEDAVSQLLHKMQATQKQSESDVDLAKKKTTLENYQRQYDEAKREVDRLESEYWSLNTRYTETLAKYQFASQEFQALGRKGVDYSPQGHKEAQQTLDRLKGQLLEEEGRIPSMTIVSLENELYAWNEHQKLATQRDQLKTVVTAPSFLEKKKTLEAEVTAIPETVTGIVQAFQVLPLEAKKTSLAALKAQENELADLDHRVNAFSPQPTKTESALKLELEQAKHTRSEALQKVRGTFREPLGQAEEKLTTFEEKKRNSLRFNELNRTQENLKKETSTLLSQLSSISSAVGEKKAALSFYGEKKAIAQIELAAAQKLVQRATERASQTFEASKSRLLDEKNRRLLNIQALHNQAVGAIEEELING